MKKIFLIICTLLFISCSQQPVERSNLCIQPIVKFDFPVNNFETVNWENEAILPLGNWKVYDTVSKIKSIELSQYENGISYIWINSLQENNSLTLARYNIKDGQVENINSANLFLSNFHLKKDIQNRVFYIRGSWNKLAFLEESTLFLGIYDSQDRKFKSLLSMSDVIEKINISSIEAISVSDAKFDDQNNLWFILYAQSNSQEEYRLFKYAFSTGEIVQNLTTVNLDGFDGQIPFVVTNEGYLYFWLIESNSLVKYDSVQNLSTTINIPKEIFDNSPTTSVNLYLNHNKLWLADYGWVDISLPELQWHKILRSSIFIFQQEGNGGVTWSHPNFMIETKDNRLWYTSSRGTGWVKPSEGHWCLFTTYQSNIVEDSDHNLWMVADNKLYKLPLGEQ